MLPIPPTRSAQFGCPHGVRRVPHPAQDPNRCIKYGLSSIRMALIDSPPPPSARRSAWLSPMAPWTSGFYRSVGGLIQVRLPDTPPGPVQDVHSGCTLRMYTVLLLME